MMTHEDANLAIKARLLSLLEQKGLSPNELATKSSLPVSTINSILNGKRKRISVALLYSICKGLNITLEEFLK